MKRNYSSSNGVSFFAVISLCLIITGCGTAPTFAAVATAPAVSDNEFELVTTGDFDGDGRPDVVIVDKDTGKYRLGYQLEPGIFSWGDFRASELRYIVGIGVGKIFAPNRDALVFSSADGNKVVAIDASDPIKPKPPVDVPFTKLGPSTVMAIDVGGPGNTPLDDLYIGCLYETPPKAFVLRNDAQKFTQVAEQELGGEPSKGIRLSLKAGQPDLAGMIIKGDTKNSFRVDDLSSGKVVTVATAPEVPAESEYFAGNFRGTPLRELVFYKTNENKLVVIPVQESAPGKYQFGAPATVETPKPVKLAAAIPHGNGSKLFISYENAETAEICEWDAAKAPKSLLTLTNQVGEHFLGVAVMQDSLIALSAPDIAKPMFSTRYQVVKFEDGTPVVKVFGGLPTLIESDEWTVAEIHKFISAKLNPTTEPQMQRYTNTIPGTDAKYVMVPIPGGEFTVGSPAGEAGRQADEGPQRKIKIEPFWMGAFEVSWNEYELFMFQDDEKRLRATYPTEEYVNKVSDAVTRPSKPYADMTFGMGKSGYPAISMTQHGANKYCQWLSAKTGHYYRLPTEAEWEYAARAGTTTAYFFGDDPKQLADYGWFGKNSDWKYQKIGKKKPNPWGLYDIYGNVVEWCLDAYDPEFYKSLGDGSVLEPWNKATKPYPHVVRGGCWDDDEPAKCRSAARRGSDRSWKMQDPQLPKSVWYFTDAQWVGFRLVRPLKLAPPEELKKYWISGVEKD